MCSTSFVHVSSHLWIFSSRAPTWYFANTPIPPRIFISYRRDDAAADAGRLADHLNGDSVRVRYSSTWTRDTIDAGTDFVRLLQASLRETAVVLVVIGRRWTSLRVSSELRRLDNAQHFVRLEMEESLGRTSLSFPWVQGAALPRSEELRHGASLSTRQAVMLNHSEFHDDASRLCDHLEKMLGLEKHTPLSALKQWWTAAVVGVLAVALTVHLSTPRPIHRWKHDD